MLKKRTKTVCGLVAAIFLLLYSWKFVQSIQVVAETADLNPGSTLLLYGIKELNRGHSGKVEQIILKNGSVIKAPVTIEKLNAQQLLEPTKIAVPTQKDREDGHVIYLRELAR